MGTKKARRSGLKTTKMQVYSEIVAQRHVSKRLVDELVFEAPRIIKFYIITQQHSPNAHTITDQKRVFKIRQRNAERGRRAAKTLRIQAILAAERATCAVPGSAHIGEAHKLQVPQKVRRDCSLI